MPERRGWRVGLLLVALGYEALISGVGFLAHVGAWWWAVAFCVVFFSWPLAARDVARGWTDLGTAAVLGAQPFVLIGAVHGLVDQLGQTELGMNGLTVMLVVLIVAAAVAVTAVSLRLRALPIAAGLAALGVVAGIARSAHADCVGFSPTAARWQGASSPIRDRIAAGLIHCGTLDERTKDGVRAVTGPPDSQGPGSWSYMVAERDDYGDGRFDILGIGFRGGRVSSVSFERDANPGLGVWP